MRQKFVKDDDGHWYLINAEDEAEFERWLDAGPYWEEWSGKDFSDCRIGLHPSCYTFENARTADKI